MAGKLSGGNVIWIGRNMEIWTIASRYCKSVAVIGSKEISTERVENSGM